MKISKLKSVTYFIFRPKAFNSLSVGYHEKLIKDLKGPSAPIDKKNLEEINLNQAVFFRRSLLASLGAVLVSLFFAIFLSYYLVSCSDLHGPIIVVTLQWVGGFIILGATLWQIEDSRSAHGGWLAEKVHNWIFRGLYLLGTFLLGLGVGIDGIKSVIQP